MDYIQSRGNLQRLKAALKRGCVTLGFIGGSITDQRSRTRWPEKLAGYFFERYPGVRVRMENTAIGATGSQLGVFRAERDLVERPCDIVFVEFAVNDYGLESKARMKSREGLIRKLLKSGRTDVVVAYTFNMEMREEMLRGKVPQSIADFELLCEHYQIGSVWMGLYALNQVQAGVMRFEEWLPDGLHPEDRGSYSYAESVMRYLDGELKRKPFRPILSGDRLPRPLTEDCWENTASLTFDRVKPQGSWLEYRFYDNAWTGSILETSQIGAGLSFSFEGTGIGLVLNFGKLSADFRYRLDNGEWKERRLDHPWWCGSTGWFRFELVEDGLPSGTHTMEVETLYAAAPDTIGSRFSLMMIGVIR